VSCGSICPVGAYGQGMAIASASPVAGRDHPRTFREL